jgi:transposase
MKKIPEQIKNKIIKFKCEGLSICDISKRLKISVFSVKKYSKEVRVKVESKKGGRPKKLSNEVSDALIKDFSEGRLKSLSDGRWNLSEKYNISICKQTVKNYLDYNGLQCRIKQKNPFLSATHKENRYNFSKKYLRYSYFDWKKVIWSDESKFSLVNNNGREFYWKKRSDPIKNDHIKKTKKYGGGSITAWGCITSEGVGELIIIEGIMDSRKYVHYWKKNRATPFMFENIGDFMDHVKKHLYE